MTTPLPTPPSTLRPLTFAAESDTFLAALPLFQQELDTAGNLYGLSMATTSTTSNSFVTGAHTFTVQTGKGFVAGMDIVAASTVTPTDRLLGTVTTYDISTGVLVIDAYSSVGTGSITAWTISMTAAFDPTQFVTPGGVQTLTNKSLTSPALTGTPTTPTAAAATNTTQVASTAHVFAERANTATLTNKTISLGSNTVTTTLAQLNTAVSDADVASLAGTETLTNKTVNLTSNTLTGTIAQFNTAISDGDLITLAGTETLTNKTINLTSNTLATTVAQLNAAVSDGDVATIAGTETLTNKSLTSPTLTGTPVAPTAAVGTNTTQVATTAYVKAEVLDKVPLQTGNNGKRLGTNGTATSWNNPDAGLVQFTATGAVTAGHVVALNSDGTVSEIGTTLNPGALGSEQVQVSALTYWNHVLDIPGTDKVVLVSSDKVYVGVVDATTKTVTLGAGTAFSFASSCSVTYHVQESVVVLAYVSSSVKYIVLGTISGSEISLAAASNGGAVYANSAVFIAYNNHQNKVIGVQSPSSGAGQVFSVSIASGVVTWNSGTTSLPSEAVAVLEVVGTPGTLISLMTSELIVTISGTTFTVYSASGTHTNLSVGLKLCNTATPGKYIAAGTAAYVILTVSGTTTTAGSYTAWPTGIYSTGTAPVRPMYDAGKGQLLIFSLDNVTNKYAQVTPCTLSGNTLVLQTPTIINTSESKYMACGYCADSDLILFAYQDVGNSTYGHTRLWDSGDLVSTVGNWVGVAAESIANAASGGVNVKGGVCTSVSGLTTGYTYYADDFGVLQQTGSRTIGTALSATKLLITGQA